jgi:hypothetical protein
VAQLKRLVAAREEQINKIWAEKQQDGKHHQEELADADVEINELEQKLQLHQEQAQTLRMQYEDMFKAFLGVVAIARPAMQAVAKLPYDDRAWVFKNAFVEAIGLQSKEYMQQHGYPSDQPLIAKYVPIAVEVFNRTSAQYRRQKAEAEKSRKPEPA